MKKWKQALALVLALVMALSLVALPSFAADGDSTGTGTAQPEWPAEGSINLIKDAQPVEDEDGVYEITLTIQGKNYKTTSDVVLVIDCSGSMEGTKLTNTRKAAKAFGDKLLTENSTTRIAIVTFIDTATAYNNGHFYTASELDAFKKAIDKATYAKGGTKPVSMWLSSFWPLLLPPASRRTSSSCPMVSPPTAIPLLPPQPMQTVRRGRKLVALEVAISPTSAPSPPTITP